MRLVAALLRGAFWFVLCVCVTHWSCVFCDCVPHLRSVFLYCVCVSRYPFVSASCVCVLRFPAASPVTQSLCSLCDFFRCSLHRFLRSAVGFVPTCRTLSLAGRGVIALTHCSVSTLSLLSYLYRLADLTARTPQIAPCLTWILSGLEFALCLVQSGVHHRLNVLIQQKGIAAKARALVDSGATGVLIDNKFAKAKGFRTTPLARPIPVTNIDGTKNNLGDITETCQVLLSITGKEGHHLETITFYLTNLGQDNLILGTDWLRLHNPDVDWQTNQITLSRCPTTCFSNPVLQIQGIDTFQP